MKHNHFRSFAILIGLLLCAGACYGVYHFWQVPAEGHWTPEAFAPPLAQVSDRVKVSIGGDPILKLVEEQRLVVREKDAETPVSADKLVASVNNYDQARFARVPRMLGLAVLAGAGFVLFLVGLFAPLIKALKPPEILDFHLEQ